MSIVLRIGAVRTNVYGADHHLSNHDAANSDTDADEVCQRPVHSYPGCFGLPYQDHNYGAPPPLSPVPPKSPATVLPKFSGAVELEEEAKVPMVCNEEEVVEDSITRCICEFLHDDGYMICCDKCSVWQHIDCMGVDRNNIPENYCCELCEPRKLDVERAKMIQMRKRAEIDTSATDTDPEEPANALASLGRKPIQAKSKTVKQRRLAKAAAREKGTLKAAKLTKSGAYRRDKKFKGTKKEKENMKDTTKKQKIMKSLPKQRKLKKKMSSSLSQNTNELWNNLNGSLFSYEESRENEYSPEIIELLSHVKANGIHSPHSIGVFPEELLVRLYKVAEVKENCKGLEATDLIVPGRAVIEFKGKVMLRQHFQQTNIFNQFRPYVFYYSKFEGLDLCVDASGYGGDARYIRRSCSPNSEMCHIIDGGKLHFIVQAKREIPKGAEITIPFDYNYQHITTNVECACNRNNCPVAKFWKKLKNPPRSPEKTRRKPQLPAEGRIRRNSHSKTSPVKAGCKSPVRCIPVKTSPVTCMISSESCQPEEKLHPVDIEQPVEIIKPVLRRFSRVASDVKEEREEKSSKIAGNHHAVSPEVPLEPHPATHEISSITNMDSVPADNSGTHPHSESEADSAGECPRKLTREERKMEAIMRAFEKMAKREERRKEALARLDKKHDIKKEEVPELNHSPIEAAATMRIPLIAEKSEQTSGGLTSPIKPCLSPIHFPDMDGKVVIKIEDHVGTPVVESPNKFHRRRPKRQRRHSRTQSLSAVEPPHISSASLPCLTIPHESFSLDREDIKEEIDHLQSLPSTPLAVYNDQPLASLGSTAAYMFHKTKKHLYNEWSVSRAPGGRMDPLEVQVEEEMVVSYTPSPRNAMEHIQRRNSASGSCYGRGQESSVGSAKKRWLRQAMHETGPPKVESGSSSPVHGDNSSPTSFVPSLPSPGGSPPTDFVTPLKKRRLARESLSQDQLPLSTPSTPSPSLNAALPDFTADPAPPICSSSIASPQLTLSSMEQLRTRNGVVSKAEQSWAGRKSVGKRLEERRQQTDVSEVTECTSNSSLTATVIEREATPRQGTSVRVSSLRSRQTDHLCTPTSCTRSSVSTSQQFDSAYTAESSDSAMEVSNCSAHVSRTYSSRLCNEASELSAVDSSQTCVNGDVIELSENHQEALCVNSLDREALRADGVESPDRTRSSVAGPDEGECSSASAVIVNNDPEEQNPADSAVSEGLPQSDVSMEIDEIGNEALVNDRQQEEVSTVLPALGQPSTVDCQVNSSQDIAWISRTASPAPGGADCNGALAESGDDSPSDKEKSKVSSAQDSVHVCYGVNSEAAAYSDLDFGPSSSTHVVHCRTGTQDHRESSRHRQEDVECNSSEVTVGHITLLPEDENVDSTTRNDGDKLTAASGRSSCLASFTCDDTEAGSFCDSNSERGNYSVTSDDRVSVSSTGPADSQSCDLIGRSQTLVVPGSVAGGLLQPSTMHVPANTTTWPVIVRGAIALAAAEQPCPTPSTTPSASPLVSSASPSLSQDTTALPNNIPSGSSAHPRQCVNSLEMHQFPEPSTSFHCNMTLDKFCTSESSHFLSCYSSNDPSESGAAISSEADVISNGDVSHFGEHGSRSPCPSQSSSEDSQGGQFGPSWSVTSSEAQSAQIPATAAKKKVSLFEYRKRLKGKSSSSEATGNGSSSSSSSSSMSSLSSNRCQSNRHSIHSLDSHLSLAPLPLFEPITLTREPRAKDKKPIRLLSLSERLRVEFGLDDSGEEERTASAESAGHSSDMPPPPPPPPHGVPGRVDCGLPTSMGYEVESSNDEDECKEMPLGMPAVGVSGTGYPSVRISHVATPVSVGNSGHLAAQTGFSWPSSLSDPHQTALGGAVAPPLSHCPSSNFASSIAQSLHPHLQGSVSTHLPNGSLPPTLSTPFTQQSNSSSSGPVQFQSMQQLYGGNGIQQQPPPPPPPNTAYPVYLAQSGTHDPQAVPGTSSSPTALSVHNERFLSVRHRHSTNAHPHISHHYNNHTQSSKHRGRQGSHFNDRKQH